MKYSVQQKILTLLRNQYDVKDEEGNVIYHVKSSIMFPYKLTFYNNKEEIVLLIKKRYLRAFPRYDVRINNELVAILKAKFGVFKKKFKIISKKEQLNNIKIQGDILGFSFQFMKDEKLVASVGKKFLSVGDKYSLDIKDEENKDVYLAVAIVIDDIVHKSRRTRLIQ